MGGAVIWSHYPGLWRPAEGEETRTVSNALEDPLIPTGDSAYGPSE
jgi:hypothetical protein